MQEVSPLIKSGPDPLPNQKVNICHKLNKVYSGLNARNNICLTCDLTRALISSFLASPKRTQGLLIDLRASSESGKPHSVMLDCAKYHCSTLQAFDIRPDHSLCSLSPLALEVMWLTADCSSVKDHFRRAKY